MEDEIDGAAQPRNDLGQMCRRAGLSDIESIGPLEGGYSNQNFLVATPAAKYVLRVYREARLARREPKLQALVGDTVPVPRILFVETDPHPFGQAFALLEYISGTRLDEIVGRREFNPCSAGRPVGEALAAIGMVRFQDSGFLDENLKPTGSPRVDAEIFEYVRNRLDCAPPGGVETGVRDQFLSLLGEALQRLPDVGREDSLVHCDFNPKNIIMRRNGTEWSVAAILDWEFAFSGTPLWDVANMLRHKHEYDPAFSESFLAGFGTAGGWLPEDWEQTGRVLDSVNIVEFLVRGPSHPFYEFARAHLTSVAAGGHF